MINKVFLFHVSSHTETSMLKKMRGRTKARQDRIRVSKGGGCDARVEEK